MTREKIFTALNDIFRDVFDDETIVLTNETTSEDIEGWDSFEQVNLIAAIEERFHIKFKTKEVLHLANVGAMADILEQKLA